MRRGLPTYPPGGRFDLIMPKDADYSSETLIPARSVSARRAVERFAHYFRREEHYDFAQYAACEESYWGPTPVKNEPRPYLLKDPTITNEYFLGGLCMRYTHWADAPPCWALGWVWIHPWTRRNGILSRAWSQLVAEYSPFWLEHPVSDAMKAFLIKQGTCVRCWKAPATATNYICSTCQEHFDREREARRAAREAKEAARRQERKVS